MIREEKNSREKATRGIVQMHSALYGMLSRAYHEEEVVADLSTHFFHSSIRVNLQSLKIPFSMSSNQKSHGLLHRECDGFSLLEEKVSGSSMWLLLHYTTLN